MQHDTSYRPAGGQPAAAPARVLDTAGHLAFVAADYRERLIGQLRTFAVSGFTPNQYERTLSAHWHLLGVLAEGAFAIAGHPWARPVAQLRAPLVQLALSWEAARELATGDLESLGYAPGPMPVDVHFWRLHFARELAHDQPTAFIGAAALQDQLLGGHAGDVFRQALVDVTGESSRCLTRLMADAGEHLEPVWNGLAHRPLDSHDRDALFLGARVGGLLMLRLYRACLDDACPSLEIAAMIDPESLSG